MFRVDILAFVLCFSHYGTGIKVFTFHGDTPDNEDLSSATLTNAPEDPLPDHFLICSSHNQQQKGTVNTKTIYVLYEDSNLTKSWFSIGFHWFSPEFLLYANVRYNKPGINHWYKLGQVSLETFLHWIHICVEVDAVNGRLSASISMVTT